MSALPSIEDAARAAVEKSYKLGFDAGIEYQRNAAPPPKAKQYRDALAALLDSLSSDKVSERAKALDLAEKLLGRKR
jgi:hypothetical protein